MTQTIFHNARLFDGTSLSAEQSVVFEGEQVNRVLMQGARPSGAMEIDLGGDILFAGFVDLQVNGGDGLMFNAAPDLGTLRRMAAAHHRLGTTMFLPTLISDRPEITMAAIEASITAVDAAVPGVAGLHLEGPHLSLTRKGAHDGAHIRPMRDDDLAIYIDAARALPCLMVTLAPESATEAQVAALTRAGVLVALGHTDADYDTCLRYFAAGARSVTHLFNAMSQLGSRAPGLVGAALATGTVSAGLIADGIHVHPQVMQAAWRAKTGPCGIYLVSDAMAVAGSGLQEFELDGRRITRKNGALTLADGTLAGADLDLARAVQVMVENVGIPLVDALRAATSTPAALIGRSYTLPPLSRMQRLDPKTWTVQPVMGPHRPASTL